MVVAESYHGMFFRSKKQERKMNETKYKDIVGEWCGKHHTQKELEAVNKGKGALAKYFAKAVNMYMLYFCFVVVVFLLLGGQF